ncbi:MAG TPA: hypothetical protein VGK99_14775 [Acidobacteriota bacterium]|jgi:hypothetical protein
MRTGTLRFRILPQARWLRSIAGITPVACVAVWTGLFLIAAPAASTPTLPDSLRVYIDLRPVYEACRQALIQDPDHHGMALKLSNTSKGGVLETELSEYASGPLARDHISKVATRTALGDGTWEKVRYRMIIRVEPIGKRDTRVIADANIEALKRSFTGKEQWVPLASNGNLEETFLLHLGKTLFGEQFSLETRKKNFWEREARYVPGPNDGPDKVAKPDLKRW